VLDIGLDLSQTQSKIFYTEPRNLAPLLRPRAQFAHKGTYGHALLLAGARGKMGAAVLAARACLRSGVGLLTVQVPAVGYDIMQISAPEAMALTDPMRDHLTALATSDGLSAYRAVGIGPGIGQHADTALLLREILDEAHRRGLGLVLDADALNLLGQHPHWLRHLPARTILTPHPKEFERLAGPAPDDFARLDQLRKFCADYRCYVILKGAHAVLCTPDGRLHFNSTGNPGMATGGTGDVLTGTVLGLLCEGLDTEDAARLAMLVHGEAGDLVSKEHGERGLTAGLLLDSLGKAFLSLEQKSKASAWVF
jgi:NAD(P)H-hydrate epimerase